MAEAETKVGGIKARIEALRARSPFVDHAMATHEHYTDVNGGLLSGAATYYGFLSFFPALAIAFAVVGYVSAAYPEARESLITAIEEVFPGIVSENGEQGTISLEQIETAAVTAGLIGLVGLLYSGLGWVSGLRAALQAAFKVPRAAQRSFVVGKVVDLLMLGVLGVVLIASVGVAGSVTSAAGRILELVGLDNTGAGRVLIWSVGVVIGLGASTLLFFIMYRLLGTRVLPAKYLWRGAFLAAAGFDLLKFIAVNVLGSLGGSAFAPLAIAITLAVWINYFSRLVVYGASWSMTSGRTSAAPARVVDPGDSALAPTSVRHDAIPTARPRRFDSGSAVLGAAAGFVVAMLLGRKP